MATAYTQIREYRDPEKLSISDTLGKAATYKQNLYDANTTAMQQLINQYAGIDLIKDIDKQYLGERLSTLTNYINQAGAMDWSRKSIFNDVSHYVGQALDTNVMNAISSTQALMKQNTEIEQKKKDGKYGVENEWLAKAGLNDYLRSNKVGDIYRPGQYFDYVDTDKKIMEALPKLKEFMIDVKWTSDGNPLLVSMEEHEVLTKEEASKYLDLALGEDGKRQLSINGLYNFRNTNEVTLKETYKSEINKNVEILNKEAKDLEIMAIGKPKEQKEKFLNYSKSLKDQASEYKNHEKNIDKLDKNTIASNIYLNEYKNKWADLLSYDKVTDWKIDDRNFRLAERNDKLSHQAWEEKFNEDKFLAEQDWKKKQYNLDMAKALSGDNPISVDENGNPNTKRVETSDGTDGVFGYLGSASSDYVYDASFVKLREVTFGYTFPKKMLGETFQELYLGLSGTNLWIIDKNLPDADPEAGLSSGNLQGFQSGVLPTTRNFAFNLKVKF